MKPSLSVTLVLLMTFALISVVAWYYLFSRINATSREGLDRNSNNDSLRKLAVNEIAAKLSFLKGSQKLTLEMIPEDWQQIGSSQDGCQLSTRHCTVSIDTCIDVEKLGEGKFSLPKDQVMGSEQKTGFAIRKLNNAVHIAACYTEQDQTIAQEVRF